MPVVGVIKVEFSIDVAISGLVEVLGCGDFTSEEREIFEAGTEADGDVDRDADEGDIKSEFGEKRVGIFERWDGREDDDVERRENGEDVTGVAIGEEPPDEEIEKREKRKGELASPKLSGGEEENGSEDKQERRMETVYLVGEVIGERGEGSESIDQEEEGVVKDGESLGEGVGCE